MPSPIPMPLLLSVLSWMIWSPACIRATGGETSCGQTGDSDEFTRWAQEYKISKFFQEAMKDLHDCEIIIICDDSVSMNNMVGKSMSRWDELRDTVKVIVDFGALFDDNGIDVYFLNREALLGVTSKEKLNTPFTNPPSGSTPLVRRIREIKRDKIDALDPTQKVLLFIATDGEPDEGEYAFKSCLEELPENVYVSILVCTDDEHIVTYLNKFDTALPRVDVTDDYNTELEQIQRVQGKLFQFSIGDYIAKALAGPISPMVDQLDEKIVDALHQLDEKIVDALHQLDEKIVDALQYKTVTKRDANGTSCTIC